MADLSAKVVNDEAAQRRAAALDAREAALAAAEAKHAALVESVQQSDAIVRLSIGGVPFTTSAQTLTKCPDTFFSVLLSGRHASRTDANGALFIDRSVDAFPALLAWLRSGELPSSLEDKLSLLTEAEYYSVAPLVSTLDDLVDGRGRISQLLAAALQGTGQAEEVAARSFYNGAKGVPLLCSVLGRRSRALRTRASSDARARLRRSALVLL